MFTNNRLFPMLDADAAPGASPAAEPAPAPEQAPEQPRTFTQEEVNALISKKVNELKSKQDAAIKAAKAEGERLAKLSAEEQAAEVAKQREADLAAREAAVIKRELRAKAAQTLADKGYDAAILDVLDYSSEESCDKSIAAHLAAIDKAVKAAALKATKGAPPPAVGTADPEKAMLDRIRQAAGLKTK